MVWGFVVSLGFHALISSHVEVSDPGGARSGACLGGPHDTDSGTAEIRMPYVQTFKSKTLKSTVNTRVSVAPLVDKTLSTIAALSLKSRRGSGV